MPLSPWLLSLVPYDKTAYHAIYDGGWLKQKERILCPKHL
jgi:hypothetical protein